jgi:hypothetical protein
MQDASKPIWFNTAKVESKDFDYTKIRLLVCTPVHSNLSIHYVESMLKLQQSAILYGMGFSCMLLKSSLVTQGRNLSVSNFLSASENYTHLLFIDSDIAFESDSLFKMLKHDKEILSMPYPLKTLDWDKITNRINKEGINEKDIISKSGYMYPIKVENKSSVTVNKGIMKVTHSPTGFMLIKRQVFDKMIEKYPNLKISQPLILNGVESERENMWNFFDTWFDEKNNKYYGEDFAFCQKWTDIGGECYCYIEDYITHVGEYLYTGRFYDELRNITKIDDSNKIK